MKLNKEQKCNLFTEHNSGDLSMLSYISELIKKNKNIGNDDELQEQVELCNAVIDLNIMNDILESYDYATFNKFSNRISDLYYDMKRELFDFVGITDKDFDKYD